MTTRDRTDDQIIAEYDLIEKKLEILRKQMEPLFQQQRALGMTKYERDNWNSSMGVKSDKVRVEQEDLSNVDHTMWTIFSGGYDVQPVDRFHYNYFLTQFRKSRTIDWSALVPAADFDVLKRYGFDDTGLRQYRKRLMRTISGDLRRVHSDSTQHLPLDVIEAAIRARAPTLQFDLTELRETFAQRWECRLNIARKEPAYQEEGSATKRKLEVLEGEVGLYRQKYPKKQRVE